MKLATIVAACGLALLVGGCSEVETALNKGGDTTCGDYLKMDDHEKRVTVNKFLKEKAGNDAEPAGTLEDLAMATIGGLCPLPNSTEVKLKEVGKDIGLQFTPPPTK